MLDDLKRDTFNLIGLTISSFGLVVLSADRVKESWTYVLLLITSTLGTIMFGLLAGKGSILLMHQGLQKMKSKNLKNRPRSKK